MDDKEVKKIYPFQGREEWINILSEPKNLLINIYGETGIGKTRLLIETAKHLVQTSPSTVVLQLPISEALDEKLDSPHQLFEQLIDYLIQSSGGRISRSAENGIVAQLNILTENVPVVVIFDNTETFQENIAFWEKLETELVGPLAREERVRQIFAGRIPVPWRRIEVRRIVDIKCLDRLPEKNAKSHIHDVLIHINPEIVITQNFGDAIAIVAEFSLGHPYLSERLAEYVANNWPIKNVVNFKKELCQEILKKFIQSHFFVDLEPPWDEILWWVSPLEWFDPTILQIYLPKVAPELTKGRTDYFYVQGLARLRSRNTVIWRAANGDRLHGTIRDIVCHCLEVLEPERYNLAIQKAVETMEEIATQMETEPSEAEFYIAERNKYHQKISEEVIKK